jgi:cell division protein FtsA
LGGRAFTKSIAERLDLPFPRAESLKIDVARGLGEDRRDDVKAIVAEDVEVWTAGVELVLEELAAGQLLPNRIFLCGGGSGLPEIEGVLRNGHFAKTLPFSRPPEVRLLEPSQVTRIVDQTKLLVDQQDVTPMALAYQALELQGDESTLDAMLHRVIRSMKI